jgi:quinoprotein glucose dehydrogenase
MAGALKVMETEPALLPLVADTRVSGKVRAAALRALAAMDSTKLAEAVRAALSNTDNTLLEAARRLAAKASPELAVRVNAAVLGIGSAREQQEALATIAAQSIPEADHVLSAQLDELLAGRLSPALQLDLLESATVRSDPALKQKLAAYETARKSTDLLAKWRECLNGGDARSGKEIFYEKAEAACLRCHKVKGEGGDVGPDLAGSGKRHDREYLLRAIIEPNAEISPGYENVLLILNDQNIIAGILRGEDTTSVTIVSLADGKPTVVQKASVKERTRVPSPMPPGLGDALGKRAVRDLVEFLANLK